MTILFKNCNFDITNNIQPIFQVRKTVHFLLLFLFSFTGVFAQLNIGLRSAAQINRTDFDIRVSSDSLRQGAALGFTAGPVVEYRMTDQFHGRTELNFSFRRRKIYDDRFLAVNESVNGFIEMPLLVGYTWGSNPVYYYIQAGPILSYWLYGRGDFFSDELVEEEIPEYPYKTAFTGQGVDPDVEVQPRVLYAAEPNRLHYGLSFNFGARFDLYNDQQLGVELRVDLNQTNIGKGVARPADLTTFAEHLNTSYQSFQIAFLYYLDLRTSEFNKGRSNANF